MRITQISYQSETYVGDQIHDKFVLTALVWENDDPKQVLEELREFSAKVDIPNKYSVLREVQNAKFALEELNKKIETRTQQWNELAHFLQVQGINPDAPKFPLSTALPPSLVEAEVVDDDDEEDEYEDEDEDDC